MITAKNAANRQAGGQGDRLGQAGGGATADADDRVDVVPRGDFAGAGGHVGRDVHRRMVVPEHDAQVSVTVFAVSNLPLGRDHHDPAGAEGGDLTRLRMRAAVIAGHHWLRRLAF